MDIYYILTRAPRAGMIILVFAVVEYLRIRHLQKIGKITSGKVVRIDESNDGNTPIVGYKIETGETHEFRVQTILGKENWSLGTEWPVRYDPTHPTRAQIDKPVQRWGKLIFLLAASLFMAILALAGSLYQP